jgi:tetratricopeptide (TPR) repeat protein
MPKSRGRKPKKKRAPASAPKKRLDNFNTTPQELPLSTQPPQGPQPATHVLNYLGYSWINQGVNLDDGMRMIKRSVEQRADDGYIVDSLGWAYYRLGNMEEAVKQLERAVELKPGDPTINDHLGDAYWRVGRVLEARFQWSHARDLKPEPEDCASLAPTLA